jgi:undecaprenyl-diphosphatase
VNVVSAIILGAIQGITEFLPISSDGHLALAYRALGVTGSEASLLGFTVFLHLGTLIAVVAYFWRDLIDIVAALFSKDPAKAPLRRTALWIAIGTVVTIPVAFALKNVAEAATASLFWIGVGFAITAGALAVSELVSKRGLDGEAGGDAADLGWWQSAVVGLAQGTAVLPGVSRSGMTIASALLVGVSRESAARFSFLLGIPIIAAANLVLDGLDLIKGTSTLPGPLPTIAGFVTAMVVGYAAIAFLLKVVRRHTLWGFAAYTAVLGAVVLFMGIVSAK